MALPFNLANLVARAPVNKIVDDRLVLADKEFGIDDRFLAEDMVDYYKNVPVEDPVKTPSLPPVSGIYNPNLLPLNFNNFNNFNDNDRDNLNRGLGSPDLVDINDDMYRFDNPAPDLELENIYEDENRFDLGPVDTVDKKKGIMEILGMLPSFKLARKGIDFFNDYREEKKAEKIIEQMRQERIKNEEIATARKVEEDRQKRNAAAEKLAEARAAAQRQKALQRSRGPIGRGDGDGGGGRGDNRGGASGPDKSGGTGGRRGGEGRYR